MQYQFVNFCLRPACRHFCAIRRAEPKTYAEVLEDAPETKRDKPLKLPKEARVNATYLEKYELRDKAYHTIYDKCRSLAKKYAKLKEQP